MSEIIRTDGRAFWTDKEPYPQKYEWLSEDSECEVAIIGGGLTGAFIAEKFASEGVNTMLVSKNPIGYGMTASSPGIVSGCVDGGINLLSDRIGREEAFSVYTMLRDAIDNIERLGEELGDFEINRRGALIYSDRERMAESIKKEYATLYYNNYDADFYDSENSFDDFSFDIKGGIYLRNLALTLDPYKLCCELIKRAVERGARVYENTEIKDCSKQQDGSYKLTTNAKKTVKAQKVIYAAGAQTATNVDLLMAKTVFNVVTEPVEEIRGWKDGCVINKVSDDMYRIRLTEDNRIMISGLPVSLMDEEGKLCGFISAKKIIEKKYEELTSVLCQNFPGIRDIRPAMQYTGGFSESMDLMPVIGNTEDEPNVFYAYCGGSNGIAFAEIAGRLIFEQFSGRHNKDIDILKKDRKVKLFALK